MVLRVFKAQRRPLNVMVLICSDGNTLPSISSSLKNSTDILSASNETPVDPAGFQVSFTAFGGSRKRKSPLARAFC